MMKKNNSCPPEDGAAKAHKRRALTALALAAAVVLLCVATALATFLLTRRRYKTEEPTEPPPELGEQVVDATYATYSYEDMAIDLYDLEARYPDLLTVASAGRSADGRELLYGMLGSPDASKSVMINAGIHGREYLTPLLVMQQLEYYLKNYREPLEDGSTYEELFEDIRFCVLPMINPDGIMLSQQGIEAIRSPELRQGILDIFKKDIASSPTVAAYEDDVNGYLTLWKANARGVDLNRNFGIDEWGSIKSRTYPSMESYKGPSANSEPETKALIDLTEQLTGLTCTVTYHSQGEIIYWDCGQTGAVRSRPRRSPPLSPV